MSAQQILAVLCILLLYNMLCLLSLLLTPSFSCCRSIELPLLSCPHRGELKNAFSLPLLEDHIELVREGRRAREAKETQRLSGKSIFPPFPMIWERFSNRLLTSQFQEMASGSGFTVVLVEVYACQESQVCVRFRAHSRVFIA